ncbi:MAG TPA: D-erythronate dehydrogenase [Streptosporangiaceae bacterium]|nr:D-erythronate dehydrogenase [Streptosporangiaceae bacterium]
MNIVITGGAGFLGARLARTILDAEVLSADGQQAAPVSQVTLVDLAAPSADLAGDPRVRSVVTDLADPGFSQVGAAESPADAALAGADVIFHLAAAVSAECEADFDLGIRSNLLAGYALLETARALGTVPVLVFASSLAVFGGSPEQPLPQVVTDTTLPTPLTSYGTQKFMMEQLVADYTRKGFVRGRSVRLMTVSVRPGRPNGAASGFLSGIVREPLAGVRAVCPVRPDMEVALSSPARTIEGLLRAAAVSGAEWGSQTALNLPSISTTVGGMVSALAEVAGPAVAGLVDWVSDPRVEGILATWPAKFSTERASRLGLHSDADFQSIIRGYLSDSHRSAVAAGD